MSVASPQSERLGLGRGSVAICIPVTAAPELLYQCVRSVLEHTAPEVPVLIADDGGEPAVARFAEELERELHRIEAPADGPVALANAAIAASGEADVVLLASHALVFDGWLERLGEAARSDTTIATASAFGNDAGLLSVPSLGERIPAGADRSRLAAGIAARSPRARPRIPAADGHCVWISRGALELAGPLDRAFGSLRAAVVDHSQRCLLRGLLNVAADDVYAASELPPDPARGRLLPAGEDRKLLRRRYPYLRQALDESLHPPLARSLGVARQTLRPVSVTIDARNLRGSFSGAQAESLDLIETLARLGGVQVRVLTEHELSEDARSALERMPETERLIASEVGADTPPTDILHRPHQVSSPRELEQLATLGRRLVITHLDLIAFHNPGYFESFEGWRQYRRVTRQALAIADHVIFLSEHAAQDAVAEALVERSRASVVPLSIEPQSFTGSERPERAPEGPFLLCIGNDFRHKNRTFAIRLLDELRKRGWEGQLVVAGRRVVRGSSRGDEAELLARRPELAAAVTELPAIGESEKRWLYENAAAVVYPTVYEGFGVIPFEAGRAGTPCLFSLQASLAETLPAKAAVLVPWDPAASAERALPLLRDGEERRRHVELLGEAAERLRSRDSIGRSLLAVYDEAVRAPVREAAALAADAQEREAELAKWIELKEELGGMIGPDAALPRDVQRAVLTLAQHNRLRRPLFALLRGLSRFAGRAPAR